MSEFSHTQILGVTTIGKTWLIKRIMLKLRMKKKTVIVFSGTGDNKWPRGTIIAYDVDTFERILKNPENYGAFVFIDEGRNLYEEMKRSQHKMINKLFTMGRHAGYTCYVTTQYPTSIPPHVRTNCNQLYCFRLGSEAFAKLVCADYGEKLTQQVTNKHDLLTLPKLQCMHVIKPDFARLISIKK